MPRKIFYSGLVQLEKPIITNLDAFFDYGADGVELFLDGPQWNDKQASFSAVKEQLYSYPFTYSVHGPMFDLNLTSENAAVRQTTLNELKRAIEIGADIGAHHVIIDPGICLYRVFDKHQARKRAIEAIKELQQHAKKCRQPIAIENIGHQGTALFDQEAFCHLLDHFPDKDMLGLVLDTGHAHLNNWNIPEVIHATKGHLLAVHLNDNDGQTDNHLAIGDGTIDWAPVLKALQHVPEQCSLILEYNMIMPYHKLREGRELLREYV
ncbi:sugar phosphate isomerase/epimerase [Lentibacillus cibarius]|uniref:Sugar phosphate isomerase/epimerase n=1 Tax=Lentibacillus cibarius TaxID=2583219 RepID=A0A549YFD6_9BACI|nr:sugar phosphate isomerase/epimerase family protein [Lentibacillus cibarius]TRM10568.1 sugar phosphate isomerase/epimerase [Lentibacillus cibarius]